MGIEFGIEIMVYREMTWWWLKGGREGIDCASLWSSQSVSRITSVRLTQTC